MEHSYHIQRYQPPPHRRNRNAANNIFISEQAEQQRRILNITSTAQNETPFALSLSLQFWNKQNTGAESTPNYFNRKEQHNPPPNKRTCSRKEINALQADEDTIPYSARTIIIDHYHTGGNNTFQYGRAETPFALYGQSTTRKGYYLPYIAL